MTTQTEALKLALEALEIIDAIERGMVTTSRHHYQAKEDTAKAITSLKEALAQPEQEPVAWRAKDANGRWMYGDLPAPELPTEQPEMLLLLASQPAPVQRTWVKLKPEHYNKIFQQARTGEHAVQLAELKLQELNAEPQRKPLTREERLAISLKYDAHFHDDKVDFIVSEVEAAHGIKENT